MHAVVHISFRLIIDKYCTLLYLFYFSKIIIIIIIMQEKSRQTHDNNEYTLKTKSKTKT